MIRFIHMIDGMPQPRFGANEPAHELPPISADDRIMEALEDLDDESLVLWNEIVSPIPYPYSSLLRWVAEFNKNQESRGKGIRDPLLTQGQHETDTKVVQAPFDKKFRIQISRTWDGKLSLEVIE